MLITYSIKEVDCSSQAKSCRLKHLEKRWWSSKPPLSFSSCPLLSPSLPVPSSPSFSSCPLLSFSFCPLLPPSLPVPSSPSLPALLVTVSHLLSLRLSLRTLIAWTCHAKNASKGAGLSHLFIKGKMMSSARSYDLPTMLLRGTAEQIGVCEAANENMGGEEGGFFLQQVE